MHHHLVHHCPSHCPSHTSTPTPPLPLRPHRYTHVTQWVSSAFVHASSEHLTRNLSVVWLAGSMVAPEVGGAGVWFAYLLAAAGESDWLHRV